MALALRTTGFVTAATLAATLLTTSPAHAAVPRVHAFTENFYVHGITRVTFEGSSGADLSDVGSIRLQANGTDVGTDTEAPWAVDWDTTGYDGVTTLTTIATGAGGSTTTSRTIVVDNKAPTGLTVRFPVRDGYIGQGGTLTVDATDNLNSFGGSELIVGGKVVDSRDSPTEGTLDLRWKAKVANGRTPMTVRVRDTTGNVTTLNRTVTVDNDKPVITGGTSAGAAVRGTFTVTLSGYRDASPLSNYTATLDSAKQSWGYGQGTARTVTVDSRDLPNGKYTLGWRATDAAGNVTVLKRSLTVDNKAPTVSISKAPKNKATVKKAFTVTAKATDTYGIAKVQLLVNGKVVKTDSKAGYAFTVNPKKYGKKFTVRLRAYDKAGNVKYTATRTYKR
ncbi:Ig-like domain-containing protein [Actinoplanes rectilineatus]|uniref:Ig-like domain-containing protein n=1 Tax=Actinoplanes rectilineatus TaxID=113571 RepID=UPI0005F2A94C|nr:Ig-like domain-containing protein [Actinoplanes rectilineatus]